MKFYLCIFLLVNCCEGKILKIGHRGAAGHALENTAQSFEKAIELGVDMIEFDVRRCKSGELIVIHDATIDRVTRGTGSVVDLTLQEIKSFLTRQPKQLLTLQEALEYIDRRAIADIELKDAGIAADVVLVIKKLVHNKGWNYNHFLVSSFNHYELKVFKELCPQVEIMPLIGGIPFGYAQCVAQLNPNFIGLYHEFIDQNFVDDAHQREMKVLVYTPNSNREIKKIKALKVEGIITDYPDRI